MKLKLISAVPAALLLVFALSGCGRNDDRLVMVTEATFPPYEFREGGKIVGIDVDLMKAVAKKTGRELVVEDMSFDSVIAAVQAGKADVAASGITVTDERKRQVGFSHPYVTAQQVVIVPKDSEIRGSADLKGKRIGVQHGTTGDLYVTRSRSGSRTVRLRSPRSMRASSMPSCLTGSLRRCMSLCTRIWSSSMSR